LKYVSYAFLLTVLLILVSNEILKVVRTEFIAEKLYFFLWNNWKLCKKERIRENLLFSFVNSRNTYHFKNQIGPPSRIKTCNCSSRQSSCSHKKSHQKCISQPFYSWKTIFCNLHIQLCSRSLLIRLYISIDQHIYYN